VRARSSGKRTAKEGKVEKAVVAGAMFLLHLRGHRYGERGTGAKFEGLAVYAEADKGP